MSLHPHPARNEWVRGRLVCGKTHDQDIEETVANYLNQTAQPGETVEERQMKRIAFSLMVSKVEYSIFLPREISPAAACDGLIYSVNYNGQSSGMQGYALPLFED